MARNEFDIIERYFAGQSPPGRGVVLGIGDDCALLEVPAGMQLAVSVDTVLAGVHFPEDTAAADVGYKGLAVNLSDLAAMGAEPAWFTLALTLPAPDPDWLAGFSAGLFELAARYGMALVGGDTTRGPLGLSIQVGGWVPAGQALRRSGARPGDAIYVTGSLGDAAAALALREHGPVPPTLRARLDRPTPRVREGLALRDFATACIDISDGLAADLGHILVRSGCGARIDLARLPRSPAFIAAAPALGRPDALVLSGGDDYELCFTAAPDCEPVLQERFAVLGCPLTRIGMIEAEPGLRGLDANGRTVDLDRAGYRHF